MRGIRVLDLSTDLAGAFCTRLLASAGAEVTIGEPPGGHPLRAAAPLLPGGRSATWEYLGAYKEAAVVGAEELDQVVGAFDVVVLSANGPVTDVVATAERLRTAHPRLVVAVTSPFGLEGPYAENGWRTTPLQDWAMGGHLSLNGEPDRQPIPGGGPWITYLAGGTAAIGIQTALEGRERTGRGDLVDASTIEAAACAHQWSVTIYTHQGIVKKRAGNRHAESHHPLALFPCADAWVCIASVTGHQWEGLCLAIDHPELLADEELYAPAARFDRADELDPLIIGWTSTLPAKEVVAILQANNCPAGIVNTLPDALADEHLAFRSYWVDLPHVGPTAKMPGVPFRLDGEAPPFRPAPEPATTHVPAAPRNEPTATAAATPAADRPLPLAGLKVLEFSIAWAGPLVGRFLGDLGADVIKIEHPTSRGLSLGSGGPPWDPAAWSRGTIPPAQHRNGTYPEGDPGERWWNRLGYFNKINRSKRSMSADLRVPEAHEAFEELVRHADIVLNNYSPRGVRSLGIDHETLRAINPTIVTAALSGFGAVGPGSEQVSWGPVLEAASGLSATTGYDDSGPYKQGLAFPDAVGGVLGTVAVLAAWHEHRRTGKAVHVDVSQLETLLALGGELALEASVTGHAPPRRGAKAHPSSGWQQDVYRCAGDDTWIAVTLCDAQQVQAAEELSGGDLAGWLAGQDRFAATAALQAAGIAAMPMFTNEDLVLDPHLTHRGFVVELDVDGTPYGFPGFPLHFAEAGTHVFRCPHLGEHNAEILAEVGYSPEQVEKMLAVGAIANRPPD